MTTILLIDEDGEVQTRLTEAWENSDVKFVTASAGEEGVELQATIRADIIILDTIFPSTTGLEVFEKLRALDKRVPVIFVANEADSETAINAMMRGAFEFLEKPIDLEKLRDVISQAIRTSKLMNVRVAVPTEDNPHLTGESFIGRSTEMLEVFKQIGKLARQNVTVLLRGESGSGKELAARAIYQHSDRADETFMAVNCAALPDVNTGQKT